AFSSRLFATIRSLPPSPPRALLVRPKYYLQSLPFVIYSSQRAAPRWKSKLLCRGGRLRPDIASSWARKRHQFVCCPYYQNSFGREGMKLNVTSIARRPLAAALFLALAVPGTSFAESPKEK